MGKRAAWLAACAVSIVGSRARALDPPFGARGQVVVSTNASANVWWTNYEATGATYVNANLAPSLDYFVLRNVSIGFDSGVGYQVNNDYKGTGIFASDDVAASAAVRGAINVPFNRFVSFWPRLTLGFDWEKADLQSAPSVELIGASITLFAPVVFSLRSHFFIGFGPSLTHDFYAVTPPSALGAEHTLLSLRTILGGYLGGDAVEEKPEPAIHWRAFGLAHEVVLGGGGGATWTSFQDTSTWMVSGSLSIGVDYFVVDRVSVGVGFDLSYAHTSSIDFATGSPFTSEQWSVALSPRVGYDVPLSPRFSIDPRAAFGFGPLGASLSEQGLGNLSGARFRAYVSAFVPLRYHVVPHFFVGFGPSVSRDLTNADLTFHFENRSTTVGAALEMAGWL